MDTSDHPDLLLTCVMVKRLLRLACLYHTAEVEIHHVQVRLLYDGKERGRMYAAYALSSIMTPTQPLIGMRAAGVIPALIAVLTTSGMLASKKGAMRALGRLARSEEAAVEIVEFNGLPPVIALLDCDDSSLVRR